LGTGEFDEFGFCAADASANTLPVLPPLEPPPGHQECVQTVQLGGFENIYLTPPWWRSWDTFHVYDPVHAGWFSLEFRAGTGPRPEYRHLLPWAYQAVRVPSLVLSTTTGTLSYWGLVRPHSDDLPPDPDDQFFLIVRDSDGVTQTAAIPLARGDTHTPDFQEQVISVEDYLPGERLAAFAGERIQLKFYAIHDGETPDTSFFIDDVRFDICDAEPIPEPLPGRATFGGLIRVLLDGQGVPTPDVAVWAYAPDGELYTTRSIHDSTYTFYNLPPGAYAVYAEVWMNGVFYQALDQVTVGDNERVDTIDLLLQ
jgi:hypothetical protein